MRFKVSNNIEGDIQEYASLLRICGHAKDLSQGRWLHASLAKGGLDGDTYLGNVLVQMYGACGSLELARRAFDAIRYRNIRSWTILLGANVTNGQMQEASRVYGCMAQWDAFSSTIVMEGCSKSGNVTAGKQIFDSLQRRDSVCWNALVAAYAHSGRLEEAKSVFDRSPEQSLVARNTMMDGFAKHGLLEEAKTLFESLPEHSVYSWNIMLAAFAQEGQITEAKLTFDEMPCRDVISYNTMLHGHAQIGRIHDAKALFESMAMVNKVSWNTIIQSCAQHGRPQEAWEMFLGVPEKDLLSWTCVVQAYSEVVKAKETFERMPRHDLVSWTAMLSVLTYNGRLAEAKSTFDRMPGKDVFCWTNMLTAYAQAGEFDHAMQMFNLSPSHDSLCWNTAVLGYAQRGLVQEATAVLDKHPVEDTSALVVSMIHAYGQHGYLEIAKATLESMLEKSTVACNVLLTAYVHNSCHKEALAFLRWMDLEGFQPDGTSFAVALNACASLQALPEGKILHREASAIGYDMTDVFVATSLLSMYGECGELGLARSIFDNMPDRSVVSWSSMVGAYAENGQLPEALELFKNMIHLGVRPTLVTFVNLLSACSHSSNSLQARKFFVSMQSDHGLCPARDHYVCMVDSLCRSGKLEDAEDLVKHMPFEPDDIALMTLLSAYRSSPSSTNALQSKVGHAARRLVEMDPAGKKGATFTATFVMLWNLAAQHMGSNWDVMGTMKKYVETGAF